MKGLYLVTMILVGCTSRPARVEDQVKQNIVNLKQPLRTEYFEVTVESTSLRKYYMDFEHKYPDKGNIFYFLKVKFKNTDTESRAIINGVLYLTVNGKRYAFDHAEITSSSLIFEPINPLTSKTVTVIYQIPLDIAAKAYYQAGRSESTDLIYLGEINTHPPDFYLKP